MNNAVIVCYGNYFRFTFISHFDHNWIVLNERSFKLNSHISPGGGLRWSG